MKILQGILHANLFEQNIITVSKDFIQGSVRLGIGTLGRINL